jgi:hypothetical protein
MVARHNMPAMIAFRWREAEAADGQAQRHGVVGRVANFRLGAEGDLDDGSRGGFEIETGGLPAFARELGAADEGAVQEHLHLASLDRRDVRRAGVDG